MNPTAIVVDDDPEVLKVTAAFLELQGIRVIAKDEVGECALQHLREYCPDLAVMDILVPGGGGLELLGSIRNHDLATRSILVTGHCRESWLAQALELGVDGFFLKPHIPELGLAVKAVLAGQRFLCPWATGFVITDYLRLKTDSKTGGLLTPRELDVLKYRVQGKSIKETAAGMDVSPKTVEKHVTKLKKKVGSGSATALASLAIKLGLAIPDLGQSP